MNNEEEKNTISEEEKNKIKEDIEVLVAENKVIKKLESRFETETSESESKPKGPATYVRLNGDFLVNLRAESSTDSNCLAVVDSKSVFKVRKVLEEFTEVTNIVTGTRGFIKNEFLETIME